MNKYRIISVILFWGCVCCAFAQQTAPNADKDNVALSVWIPNNTGLTADAQKNLYNKVTQIVSNQGVAADITNSRFVVTVNVVILEKNITPTAPPQQAYKLDVTFYIGDGIEGKTFSSMTTTVKGVGENETKAYMNALKNISVSNPAYKKFVDEGKAKIVDYYNSQCYQIINEAQTLASTQNYDEAIYKLMSVPDVCSDCKEMALSAVDAIYQKKIDYDCNTRLNEATNIWNAEQNVEGAKTAGAVLSEINANANCYTDAQVLSRKIAEQIKKLDERAWEEHKEELAFQQEMEQKEFALKKATKEKNHELEKERIKAYRDVQKAYAANQPSVVYIPFW